ncbi:MAG: hypothetical protein KDE19_03430 [Caldilineaceae bacterium]|nr:hypothetical protein [Caldilineaceae bacterium]
MLRRSITPNSKDQQHGYSDKSQIANGNTTFNETQARQNYYTVISRILDLLLEDEIDDEYGGETLPTKHAVNRVLAVLSNTYEILGTVFPKASASTSFNGGIRVQWMHPQFSVRLIIPSVADQDEYIFSEDEETYGTEKVSAETLAANQNPALAERLAGQLARISRNLLS